MDNLRKQADMQERTWIAHPRYSSYEVSDDGLVRSIPRQVANRWGGTRWVPGRVLAVFRRKGGYLGGNISINGQRINFEVHAFVCEAFHGLRPAGDIEARHLNGDRLDNRAANLAWGTKSENMNDKVAHGTHHEANKTHCPTGHEYTVANTYRAPSSPRKRQCRICMQAREARRQSRAHRKVG